MCMNSEVLFHYIDYIDYIVNITLMLEKVRSPQTLDDSILGLGVIGLVHSATIYTKNTKL